MLSAFFLQFEIFKLKKYIYIYLEHFLSIKSCSIDGVPFLFFLTDAFCSFEVCVAQTCCQTAGVDGKLDNSWLTDGCGVCTGGQCEKSAKAFLFQQLCFRCWFVDLYVPPQVSYQSKRF